MCPVTTERRTRIVIATASNLRDLGGWPTAGGGWIRPGLVYRSAELSRLHGDDLAAFDQLGVRTVFDLRTAAEVASHPDALPEETTFLVLDVLADARHAAPAELQRVFENPATATEFLREGQAERYFEEAYRGFVTLPSARAAYRELLEGIASADGPVLYHCATGKDRTGWATAVLFRLLGVPEDQVLEEYLLTNTELLPTLQPWMDQFAASGGDPQLLIPILGVQESYLAAATKQMEESFGSVEDYVTEGLGVSPETIEALREKLLAD
jgi:protein-tyrosine phosphatase